jgi:asparaginyl-tRNA synthetase
LRTGDAVEVSGVVVESKGNQAFEIQAKTLTVINRAHEDYPLQKKRHTVEYLREIAHLRPKANIMMAVMKIRSVLAQGIHEFFANENFV